MQCSCKYFCSSYWAKRASERERERQRARSREIPQVLISASLKATVEGRGRVGARGCSRVFPVRKFMPHAIFIVHSLRVSAKVWDKWEREGEEECSVAGLVTLAIVSLCLTRINSTSCTNSKCFLALLNLRLFLSARVCSPTQPHPHAHTPMSRLSLWLRLPALSSCEALKVREMLLQKFINLLCACMRENPKMSQQEFVLVSGRANQFIFSSGQPAIVEFIIYSIALCYVEKTVK